MTTLTAPTIPTREEYDRMAEEYMANLPLEHFMERTVHSLQREIAVASFAIIAKRRPDIQLFSELLVQYPRKGYRRNGQVVPDNMVVISDEKIAPIISYSTAHEPAKPFMVMEYVSPGSGNQRKDYQDNFLKYERELLVAYYLIFDPEEQQLDFFRHNGAIFETRLPDRRGRYEVPELELELGIHEECVRYWFRGELVPITAELEDDNQALKQKNLKLQADKEKLAADKEKLAASNEKLTIGMDDLLRKQRLVEEENARLREELAVLIGKSEKR